MTTGGTFETYRLPDEYEAIRQAVRDVCDAKVAPNAAEADETAEFPKASYEALRAADFHAPHIPIQYGGAGADALAAAIVIEEVARACASTSLVPAVNKLGTMPLLLAGSEELRQRYLPPVARGESMFSYCLSEPEAGSDAAAMTTRAVPDGHEYVLNGAKRLNHQRRPLGLLHGLRDDRARQRRERHLRLRGREVRSRRQLRSARTRT